MFLRVGLFSIGILYASAAYALSPTTVIKNLNSRKCVYINVDGARLVQFQCNGKPGERFTLVPIAQNVFQMKVASSGKCIDGTSLVTGAELRQARCSNSKLSQQFRFSKNSDGSYAVKNAKTEMCLDIRDSSVSDRAPAQIWDCNGSTTQAFEIPGFGA